MRHKPMLCENKVKLDRAKLNEIKYPVLCSIKHDGFCAITSKRGGLTRKLERIPNNHVRELLGTLPAGYHGELTVDTGDGVANFRKGQSLLRRIEGQPKFIYRIFDYQVLGQNAISRYQILREQAINLPGWALVEPQTICYNAAEVWEFYTFALAAKHEGIVGKYAGGMYKHGRSTWNEGPLMWRVKEYETDEAVVVGVEEEMHNGNDLTTDAVGMAKRATLAENLYGKGTMGSLVCRSRKFSKTFKIGSGFTSKDRFDLWANRPIGQTVHYRYDPSGGYDRPRQPVFKGFREKEDA